MSLTPSNFEDPDLKNALRRVHAGHRASSAVKTKVGAMLAAGPEGSATEPGVTGPRVGRRRYWAWAAAAAVLLSAAGAGGYWGWGAYHEYREELEFVQDNGALLSEMIVAAQAEPTADSVIPQSPGTSVRLNETPDFSDMGYRMRRLTKTTVGGKPAFKAEYEGGGREFVVLTIAASVIAHPEPGEAYVVDHNGFGIAGVVNGETARCVVARGSQGIDLDALVQRLK